MASAKMDKSAGINYLEKKQAMLHASNIMEHALKTIADVFKNVQADFSSLVDDNKRLESLVKELSERKNECTLCTKNIIWKSQLPNCCEIEPEKNSGDVRCDDGETLGIIESTQIEERVLTKSKCRLKDKRSNPRINGNESDNLSLSIGTQTKSRKRPCIAKVSAEIRILSASKISQHHKNVSQLVDGKENEEISDSQMNNGKLDSEYLDIDATLFEQPFSQEQSPNKKSQITGDAGDIGSLKGDVKTTSPVQSFLDDVVEVSPKKNVLRKKNWLRHNRPTAKSCLNDSNSDISGTLGVGNDDKGKFTQKSLKYITTGGKEEGGNNNKARVETKARTSSSKTSIISPRVCKKKESPALLNEPTLFSLPPTEVTASAMTAKSNTQIETKGRNKNVPVTEILIRTQSGEPTSDETYFFADETYCPAHGISPKKNYSKDKEEIVNRSKRKFSEISTSGMEKNINPTSSELELDIGDMSDWDTDISCDKWPHTPQKRALVNSFDTMPAKKETAPKFATKGPVVRKKSEREKLRGWDCENCCKYYENMGLSKKELIERKNQCSRHRSKFNERYFTPPGLWDLRFPDTQTLSQD